MRIPRASCAGFFNSQHGGGSLSRIQGAVFRHLPLARRQAGSKLLKRLRFHGTLGVPWIEDQ